MGAKGGRKTREEKLEILKASLKQKVSLKEKLNEEIREIEKQISEIEQYYLIQEATKLKEVLDKKGISIEDISKAIENGNLNIPKQEEGEK